MSIKKDLECMEKILKRDQVTAEVFFKGAIALMRMHRRSLVTMKNEGKVVREFVSRHLEVRDKETAVMINFIKSYEKTFRGYKKLMMNEKKNKNVKK